MIPIASMASSLNDDSSQEIPIEENLIVFSDGLKDLRNLKSQLYSAAEYFEFSYMHEDQKQSVMNNAKDYVLKALINAVDHLGSMSFKINNHIQDKATAITEMQARLPSMEQKIKAAQDGMDHMGLREQAFPVPKTPRLHKRYLLPSEGNISELGCNATPSDGRTQVKFLDPESTLYQDVVLLRTKEKQSFELAHSPQLSPSPSIYSATSPTDPRRNLPSIETGGVGSLSIQQSQKRHHGESTPAKPPLHTSPSIPKRFVVEVQKSPKILKTTSLRPPFEDGQKDSDHIPNKGKHFLKSLLSKKSGKSKKYDMNFSIPHGTSEDE